MIAPKDPYDVKVTQDPDDPTLVHVTMRLPTGMVARCEPSLIDLPENPTIQSTEEAHKRLSDALADWMTRGNMRHEAIEEERAKVMAEAKERAASSPELPSRSSWSSSRRRSSEQIQGIHRDYVKAAQKDAEPRPKGCECHLEAGDSPCPVHGDVDS